MELRNKELENENGLTLAELVTFLKNEPSGRMMMPSFGHPHSYRGYYDEIAFVPTEERRSVVGALNTVCGSIFSTYYGWKGGEYVMTECTPVWIAKKGCEGERLTEEMLKSWLQ